MRANELYSEAIMPRLHKPMDLVDKDWLDMIKTNCSEYLNVMRETGKLLYRGTSSYEHQHRNVYKSASPTNRQPTHSDADSQTKFDYYLSKLGIKALRKNSTFIINDIVFAMAFGKPYAIFPCDGSPFAWSRTTPDQVIYPKDVDFGGTKPTVLDKMLGRNYNVDIELDSFQKKYQIDGEDLHGAIVSKHAIWFSGPYIAVNDILARQSVTHILGPNASAY